MATIKSIEEKAKRYDEAIVKLRGMMPNWERLSYNGKTFLQDLVHILPELKESEEEEIRKMIINHLEQERGSLSNDEAAEAIAWLEKQGHIFTKKDVDDAYLKGVCDTKQELEKQDNFSTKEVGNYDHKKVLETLMNGQKPADKVEPKFHEGDIIIHKELGGNFVHFPHKIIQVDILDKKYRLEGGFVAHFSEQEDYELVEQNHDWSEEDERMYKAISIALSLKDAKVYLSSWYKTPEEADNWLKSLKDRVQPQPKQEWGKEDEKLLHDLSDTYFYNDEDYPEETYKQMLKRVLDWMNKRAKSLRPQNHWKPSDEQMDNK